MATAIVVAVLRPRRSPAVSGAGSRAGTVPGAESRVEVAPRPEAEAVQAPRWPQAPILGTPTADDLKRYAVESRLPAFLTREITPRAPLDRAVRRTLNRWGAVACTLCLLALGSQVLENAVFSKETGTEYLTGVLGESVCPPYGQAGAGEDAGTCVESGEDFSRPWTVHEGLSGEAAPQDQETPSPEAVAPVQDADCHPAARVPHRRPLSPKVTRAVDRQWGRIEKWLRANAPATYRTLAGPARPGTIAVAEAQMGLRFPDDLRASLLRHNGSVTTGRAWGFGPMGEELLDVRQIRDTWRMLCGIGPLEGDYEPGVEPDPRGEVWDGRMVPFGADGVGGHLLVDSVEHDVGKSAEDGPLDFMPGGVRVRSYYALLKATADALETGGTIGHWKPRIADGNFDWNVVEGTE